jgi:fumarate reductase subunit C
MTKNIMDANPETKCSTIQARWVVLIIAVAGTVLGAVFGTYWYFFSHLSISDNPASWGVFGDFVGGTANPILSFITIVLLAFTIILQARQLSISSRELQLSRKELALTRKELERSAKAQEFSEEALKEQARAAGVTAQISTINALMEYYDQQIEKVPKGLTYSQEDPRFVEIEGFKRRYSRLQQRLEQIYVDFMGLNSK